jgi:hypothetical protein
VVRDIEGEVSRHVVVLCFEERYREAREEICRPIGPRTVVARVDDAGASNQVKFADNDKVRDRRREAMQESLRGIFGGWVENGKEPAAVVPEGGGLGWNVDAEEERQQSEFSLERNGATCNGMTPSGEGGKMVWVLEQDDAGELPDLDAVFWTSPATPYSREASDRDTIGRIQSLLRDSELV